MEINDVEEMAIVDFFKMCELEEGEYQIDTPDGWQNINFLVTKKNRKCYKLITEKGKELECSITHKVLTGRGWKESQDIDIQRDLVSVKGGLEKIVKKKYAGIQDTFDMQVNSESHSYFSNDIVSHNCGKSLVCKAISSSWKMPLLRLDFGKLFGSLVGDSEKNARAVIKLVESVSPAILWIDEIEKAISGGDSSGRSDGGTTSRVLSTFLTWMQEKTSPVFVVATANDHEAIPAEFLRAGRFDEIFFVDLPNIDEREEIFDVLLKLRNLEPDKFNLSLLSQKSKNYSGAEIEKAIDNAMLNGYLDGARAINTDDIAQAANDFKSLFEMREGDFEELREWADKKCKKANADPISKKVNHLQGASAKKIDL